MFCDGDKCVDLWDFTPFWSEVPPPPPTSLFRSFFKPTRRFREAPRVACGDKDVKMGVKRDGGPFFGHVSRVARRR
jgi:hypothetical protein